MLAWHHTNIKSLTSQLMGQLLHMNRHMYGQSTFRKPRSVMTVTRKMSFKLKLDQTFTSNPYLIGIHFTQTWTVT